MPATDEYGVLGDEINRLQQNVRVLWASAFAFYFGALGVFAALLVNLYASASAPDDFFFLLPFLQWGGGNVMSALLLGICLAVLYFGYTWLRRAHYVGAYVQVFHEAGNAALNWITLDRGDRHKTLGAVRADAPRGLADSLGVLVVLALVPSIVCTVYSSFETEYYPDSFLVTLMAVLILLLFCTRWHHKLRILHGERLRLIQAWLEAARGEQTAGQPVTGAARDN